MELPDWLAELIGQKAGVLPPNDFKYAGNPVGTSQVAPQEISRQSGASEPYSLAASPRPWRDIATAVDRSIEGYSPGLPHLAATVLGMLPQGVAHLLASLEGAGQGIPPTPEEVGQGAGAITARGMLQRPQPGVLGTFVGATAKLPQKAKDDLLTAKILDRWGGDPELIRSKTGWDKTADGKWRYEISDEGHALHDYNFYKEGPDGSDFLAAVAPRNRDFHKLEDVLDHPQLFASTPALRDTKFNTSPHLAPGSGYFNPGVNGQPGTIMLGEAPSNLFRDTLFHEIQHQLQDFYGFPRGGQSRGFDRLYGELAPEEARSARFRDYQRLAGEVEAELVAKRRQIGAHELKLEPTYPGERPWREQQLLLDKEPGFPYDPAKIQPVDPNLTLKNLAKAGQPLTLNIPEAELLSPAYRDLLRQLIREGWKPQPGRGTGTIQYVGPKDLKFGPTIEGEVIKP